MAALQIKGDDEADRVVAHVDPCGVVDTSGYGGAVAIAAVEVPS
jgi:hypothetical protein